jgi:hypothetical protein
MGLQKMQPRPQSTTPSNKQTPQTRNWLRLFFPKLLEKEPQPAPARVHVFTGPTKITPLVIRREKMSLNKGFDWSEVKIFTLTFGPLWGLLGGVLGASSTLMHGVLGHLEGGAIGAAIGAGAGVTIGFVKAGIDALNHWDGKPKAH